MKRMVIYTVLVGAYDEILQPVVVDSRFDYLLFSNDIQDSHVGVWKVCSIPAISTDNKILSRYPKINPEFVLSEYDFSLYIDANIQILDAYIYSRCLELASNGTLWAGVKHPERNCIYEEAFMAGVLQFESDYKAFNWLNF